MQPIFDALFINWIKTGNTHFLVVYNTILLILARKLS